MYPSGRHATMPGGGGRGGNPSSKQQACIPWAVQGFSRSVNTLSVLLPICRVQWCMDRRSSAYESAKAVGSLQSAPMVSMSFDGNLDTAQWNYMVNA